MSGSLIASRNGDVTTIGTNKADDGNRLPDEMAIEMGRPPPGPRGSRNPPCSR